AKLSQAARAIPFSSFFAMHVDAFEITYLRSFTDYVSLEDQAVVLDPNPDTLLFNSPCGAIAETTRIALERACATLFKSHRGVYGHDFFQIVCGRRPEVWNVLARTL